MASSGLDFERCTGSDWGLCLFLFCTADLSSGMTEQYVVGPVDKDSNG